MSDSLASTDCADLRRFWKWSHANSNANPLAGLTFALGYSCVTDVCAQLNEDSGPVPLIEGTDYTVEKDAGTISFLSGGTPAFFKSNTTTVDVWFNVLVCTAVPECRSAPCCDDAGDEVYVSVRRNNCVPVPVVGFLPPSGTTQSFPLTVTLTVSRTDAVIYYTTDGSEPTADSTLYTAPFALSDCSNIVKAIGIVPGCSPGPTNVCQYVCGPPLDSMVGWYVATDYTTPSWADRSGLGNHLTLNNGNYSVMSSALNGQDIVHGSSHATAQMINGTFIPGGVISGYSMILVRRRTDNSFLASLSITGSSQLLPDASIVSTIAGSVDTIVGVGFGGEESTSIDLVLNQWNVLSLTFDNTEQKVRLYSNGAVSVGNVSGGGVTVNNCLSQDGKGDVAEIICYRKKLSTLELAQARNYLANKYGIAITV